VGREAKLAIIGMLLWLLGASAPARCQDLLVSGASSLTNVFKEISGAFERTYPETKVVFNFAASDVLVKQIIHGAPVDVFASADQEAMDKAVQANVVDGATRVNFAANQLVLAVSRGSRVDVSALEDLQREKVRRIAISHPGTVPVGRYTKAALDHADLWMSLQKKFIYTQNVRQTLDYLARGEVDVGFVYVTDVMIVKDKVMVVFAVPTLQAILYPMAITRRTRQPRPAINFSRFVLSASGQEILRKHGFIQP
jgi:molybdate transport system substrate-binding protein